MEKKIITIATQLSIRHSDDVDIPIRYRTRSAVVEKTKSKFSEAVEARFAEKVKSWINQINSMLSHLETDQAWRFITTSPIIALDCNRAVDCQDFLDFNQYMARRRDEDLCNDEELGTLAVLLTELQAAVEREVSRVTPS